MRGGGGVGLDIGMWGKPVRGVRVCVWERGACKKCAWAWSLYATGVWDGDAVSVRVRGNPGGGGESVRVHAEGIG